MYAILVHKLTKKNVRMRNDFTTYSFSYIQLTLHEPCNLKDMNGP